jgi:hypothetical protein
MKTKILSITILLLITISLTSKIYSQDQPTGHFYEMNFLAIPYEKLNDFNNFYEKYGKPADAENEYIISVKVFRHVSGPVWNICFLTEYKDMESFVAAGKRGDEIFVKMFPDKSQRDEFMKMFEMYLTGHTDALVRDNPKLEKK